MIDHVSTNKPDCVSSSGIISCGISEQDAVYLVRSMRVPKMRRDPKTVTVRTFRRFDLDAFKSDLQGVHFDEVKSLSSDPKEMWLIWKTLDALRKHAPVSNIKIKGNNLRYITAEVRQLARQRDYLRKKANNTGSKYLRQAFQQMKYKITYKVRKLRSECYSKTTAENQGDIKATGNVLKELMET